MTTQDPRTDRRSLLDRAMGLFSEVRAGEAPTALLLLLNLFLILVAYYVIKTVREPLIRQTGGAELRSYAAAFQAGVLMLAVPAYGFISARVTRVRLIVGVTIFFLACLELFYVGALAQVPFLGFAFFVWVGIFSVAVIAQFWSFANDIYDQPTGERLFPIIGIGATVGSVAGSYLAKRLFEWHFGATALMQIAAGMLALHLVVYFVLLRRPEASTRNTASQAKLTGKGGFTLVFLKPYLRLIALLLILLNLVNTTGEYILNRTVGDLAEAAFAAASALDSSVHHDAFIQAYFGSFYGEFFTWVNIVGVLVQAFVVSRIVKYTGIGGVLFALPVVALGAYSLVTFGVAFSVLRWAKTAENATDYSVMNTAKAMLWLPTTRDEKYKAKQAIDTFFVRLGDVLSAGLVFVGTEWLGFGARDFGVANVVLVLVWLGVAWLLLREYRRLTAAGAATPTQNTAP